MVKMGSLANPDSKAKWETMDCLGYLAKMESLATLAYQVYLVKRASLDSLVKMDEMVCLDAQEKWEIMEFRDSEGFLGTLEGMVCPAFLDHLAFLE